jgi:hypothetical protein
MPIAQNDLRLYMHQATAEMQSDYDRIRGRSKEDPGTAGDNGEEDWKKLLLGWLPPIFPVVAKGRIMNSKGECTDQVDLLVLSPMYPTKLLNKKEYLAGGVIAAFECRITLRSNDIKETFEHAKQIRAMCGQGVNHTPFRQVNGGIAFGLLAQSHNYKAQGSRPCENVRSQISIAEQVASVPSELPDFISVADLGTWNKNTLMLPQAVVMQSALVDTFRTKYGALNYSQGVVESGYIEYSAETQHVPDDQGAVTPIGALIVQLLQRMAWDEPALRRLAEYFILSNVSGSGRGYMRAWPLSSCLKSEAMSKVNQGFSTPADGRWNEWGMSL